MYSINNLKKEVVIELDGVPYRVVDSQHVSLGRGGAVMRTKLKNLLTGNVLERTFRAAEKITPAEIERVPLQYLYREGSNLVFMHASTFEQHHLPAAAVGEAINFVPEGTSVSAQYFGKQFIGLDMPNNVYLKVIQTEPGARGDTATTALKPAKVETGIEVNVPLFINEGDVIKVDTRSGQYLERKK